MNFLATITAEDHLLSSTRVTICINAESTNTNKIMDCWHTQLYREWDLILQIQEISVFKMTWKFSIREEWEEVAKKIFFKEK